MIDTLSDLINYQTHAGNKSDIADCFDYIHSLLTKSSLHIHRHICEGFPSLVATTQPSLHPKLLLQAHLDVVPAHSDFYKLSEKSGKLYGRGVFDMKFAAACYLQLLEDLADELDRYDFGIMLTSDEEIGGENGVGYLLDKGYGADVCILPDGGNDWQIETTCNGVWIIRLSAQGQSAHGSRPWEGQNAINSLLKGLEEIHDLFGELRPNKNSITVSKIQGGSAVNQVPDYAEAILDMRFITDNEYRKNKQRITDIAHAHHLTLHTVARVKARNVAIDNDEVQSFLSIAEDVLKKPVSKTHSLGASDACHFAGHGIPTIVIRPTGGGAHSDHEWINKAELLNFYELLRRYVLQTTCIDA